MIFNFFLKNKKGGYLVLTLVLLVTATVLIIVSSILLNSISEANENTGAVLSSEAWSTVNACGEYALGQLASTTDSVGWSYGGEYSLSVGTETCYIYSIVASGTSKFIKASSTVSGYTKKILIEVATNTPKLKINSWQEVADF